MTGVALVTGSSRGIGLAVAEALGREGFAVALNGPADDAELAAAEAPVVLHWLGEMFDPALRGYWGADRFEDALDTGGDHRRPSGQGRRNQDLAPRQGQGDRAAPPPARGSEDVHRRRLQLSRADRGRRPGLQPRAARHLRPARPGGGRRPAGAGGCGGVPRFPRPDRAAGARDLPGGPGTTRPGWRSSPG